MCIRTPSRGPPPWYDCGGRTKTGNLSVTSTGKDWCHHISYPTIPFCRCCYVNIQRLHHCLCFMQKTLMSKYFCTVVQVIVVAHWPILTTRVIIGLSLRRAQLLLKNTINCKCFSYCKNISDLPVNMSALFCVQRRFLPWIQ